MSKIMAMMLLLVTTGQVFAGCQIQTIQTPKGLISCYICDDGRTPPYCIKV